MMKKSWYIKLLLTAGLSVIVESSCLGNEEYSITAQKISSKPNFIFIAVDDLNIYNTVSGDHSTSFLKKIYPDQQQRSDIIKKLTPNLKKIANKGITFQNAYSAAPLCGPSRTALMTGVAPHISGYYMHDRHFRAYKTLTNVTTLPQYLKENGYHTAGIGKVFHKERSYLDRGYFSDWPDQLYSWNDWIETNTGTGAGEPVPMNKETISKYWDSTGKSPKDYTRFGLTSVPTESSNDYLNSKFIAELITQGQASIRNIQGKNQQLTLPKEQPFFLAAGIFAPHLPWVVEQKFYDLFPIEQMQIDEKLVNWVMTDLNDLSVSGNNLARQGHFVDIKKHGLTLDNKNGDIQAWKASFQAYLATVAYADECLGLLLDAIEKNPRKNNTIVVLWSDHGYHTGDKNRSGKVTLWENANHANVIIIDPSSSTLASVTSAPISLQDLYPTIVSMAGLSRPKHIYGYDLTTLIESPHIVWNKPVLNTNQQNNHAIRTNQYRYISYENGDQELYDMINDPFEEVNLVKQKGNEALIAQHHTLLIKELAKKPHQF